MIVDKAKVKRILVISLSNVGDVILTTPVISCLAEEFPEARIDVMLGPKGEEVFVKDPRIAKVIVYDKHAPMLKKRRLVIKLRKLGYDMVVDLRNTIFPMLIGAQYRTSTLQKLPSEHVHKKDQHLARLRCFGIERLGTPSYLHIPKEDDAYVSRILGEHGVHGTIVAVNPGAKSHIKRWTEDGFASVCNRLIDECGVSVVLIGCSEDRPVTENIAKKIKGRSYDLVGRTNIRQLAALLKRSRLLITNDSAPLHVGCAAQTKVLALFGPTDHTKYGPTGEMDMVIRKELSCSPCEKAECRYHLECMHSISPDEVFDAAREMLEGYEIR